MSVSSVCDITQWTNKLVFSVYSQIPTMKLDDGEI